MADISKGKTFSPSEEVTNTKLHQLVDNAVITDIQSTDLVDGLILEAKIGAGAVTKSKISDGAVDGAKIEADAIIGTKIADDAIDSEHIVDGAIDLVHIDSDVKSGSDATLVTGTAGTDGYISKWNSDGDLVDGYEVSTDDSLSGDSDTAIPTEQAVKYYVDNNSFSLTSYTAGDILVIESTSSSSSTNTSSYNKVKEIRIVRDGTLRIKITGSNTAGGDGTSYFKIYRNGSAVGTQRSTGETPATWSEDISGWSVGDLCQVYAYNSDGTKSAKCTEFGLYTGVYTSLEEQITDE